MTNQGKADAQAIISADDFGLSLAVNEGIERAYRAGILSTTSLMVAGAAAEDAVARARANPGLRVGLHLVVIEGPAVLPPAQIPNLVDAHGQFPSDQLRLGVDYFFRPHIRQQLWAEIQAQFAAFAATGLTLDHANAHKHMHLHPTVGAMLLRAGQAHDLRAVRIPSEPVSVMERCGSPVRFGDRLLYAWTRVLRAQARRAGMRVNDAIFGLNWTGHMTSARLATLIPHLPPGLNEIYFHPATGPDATLQRLMPDYDHAGELAALLDADIAQSLARHGVEQVTWR